MIRDIPIRMLCVIAFMCLFAFIQPAFATHRTPVKVALDGRDALVNGTNSFILDLDGFAVNKYPMIKTSGGLNSNEAWLITDRRGNGYFSKTIVDGDDIFGDHMGNYPSGYEDLAALYQRELKTDEQGKRYIPLKSTPWWKRFWYWLLRVLHLSKKWHASYDLFLLDASYKLTPARDVLTRVYVDYRDVDEVDSSGKNFIWQRAPVHYTNGTVAESGDQWFTPVTFLESTKDGSVKEVTIEGFPNPH